MVSVSLGIPSHDVLPGVSAGDHHAATVAGDLNLADLAARAHADLSDAPANAHHAAVHIIPTHGDTSATGAELNSLTDGSEVTLHTHAAVLTVLGSAATAVAANVTVTVNTAVLSDAVHYQVLSSRIAGAATQSFQGVAVGGDELVDAESHNVVFQTADGVASSAIRLTNGSAGARTHTWEVSELRSTAV